MLLLPAMFLVMAAVALTMGLGSPSTTENWIGVGLAALFTAMAGWTHAVGRKDPATIEV